VTERSAGASICRLPSVEVAAAGPIDMASLSFNRGSHTDRTLGPASDGPSVEKFDTRTSLLASTCHASNFGPVRLSSPRVPGERSLRGAIPGSCRIPARPQRPGYLANAGEPSQTVRIHRGHLISPLLREGRMRLASSRKQYPTTRVTRRVYGMFWGLSSRTTWLVTEGRLKCDDLVTLVTSAGGRSVAVCSGRRRRWSGARSAADGTPDVRGNLREMSNSWLD